MGPGGLQREQLFNVFFHTLWLIFLTYFKQGGEADKDIETQ